MPVTAADECVRNPGHRRFEGGDMHTSNYALRGILLGGFFAGLADFIYPTVKTVMNGGSWMRPWKGVASGLVGPEAHQGGLGMVLLGASLHWFICLAAAAILYLVVRRLRWLPRNGLLLACLHGIAVLLAMNYVILPLSRIGKGIYPLATLHISAFWHILLVGVPTGFFVAWALRREGAPAA
jgi:hypothetical protein